MWDFFFFWPGVADRVPSAWAGAAALSWALAAPVGSCAGALVVSCAPDDCVVGDCRGAWGAVVPCAQRCGDGRRAAARNRDETRVVREDWKEEGVKRKDMQTS